MWGEQCSRVCDCDLRKKTPPAAAFVLVRKRVVAWFGDLLAGEMVSRAPFETLSQECWAESLRHSRPFYQEPSVSDKIVSSIMREPSDPDRLQYKMEGTQPKMKGPQSEGNQRTPQWR